MQVPAIVIAERITPQDVQLLKGENVVAFVVMADGFEAKLTTAIEKVLR